MGKSKLQKELRRLSEHRTNKCDNYCLGKGVFSLPLNRNRTKNKKFESEIRVGEKFQAVLPEYTSQVCLKKRKDVLISRAMHTK
jgi:hypothetical protein